MLFASKFWIICYAPIWTVEKSQSEFHAQYASYGIVDTAHRNFFVFYKLYQGRAESNIVRLHHHINAGIDSCFYSASVISSNVVAIEKVRYVGPVGNDYSVKIQFIFHPFCYQPVVGVGRNAVDNTRVHHQRESFSFNNRSPERLEEFFTKFPFRNNCRCTIFTGNGHTISHVVLDTSCNIIASNVVVVGSLETFY